MTAIAKKAKAKGYISESKFEGVFQFFLKLIFVIMSITFIYPYLHVLVQSFEHPNFVNASGFKLFPKQFSVDAYTQMFNADYLWSGYANTLKVCFMGWALSISAVVLCAYPLSKPDLPFRGLFTTIVIVTMFVSGGLIPTYLLVTNTLGMKNTYWAILLPHIVSVSHIVIARNFFMSLPAGLEDNWLRNLTAPTAGRSCLRLCCPCPPPFWLPSPCGLWSATGTLTSTACCTSPTAPSTFCRWFCAASF